MKTSELTGSQLAHAVARAEGYDIFDHSVVGATVYSVESGGKFIGYIGGGHLPQYAPHEQWTQGGPVIERMRIKLMPTIPTGQTWYATKCSGATVADMILWRGQADTPLVAAMRCYVHGMFGDEVPHG